jgi:hypothetical protein
VYLVILEPRKQLRTEYFVIFHCHVSMLVINEADLKSLHSFEEMQVRNSCIHEGKCIMVTALFDLIEFCLLLDIHWFLIPDTYIFHNEFAKMF